MPDAARGAHLLLVSLGPIQDFIASARRCQDLWFGSWLLSELARSVAASFADALGPEALVFPAGLAEDRPGVANKILVVVPETEEVQTVAGNAADAMRRRMLQLADRAFELVDPRGGETRAALFDDRVALEQVDDLMEYLWVAVPLGHDYGAARDRAERLLAARKSTRPWRAVPWTCPPSPKSSLDGQRESVYRDGLYQARFSSAERRSRYFVKPAERLCGIGVLKRIGSDEDAGATVFGHGWRPVFHSTSHVAASPLLVRMAGTSTQVRFDGWLDALRAAGVNTSRFRVRTDAASTVLADPLDARRTVTVPRAFGQADGAGFDGSLLFEDRLAAIVDENSTTEPAAVRTTSDALRTTLRGMLAVIGRGRPTPYYALLQADGDRMGRALDQLARGAGAKGLERHRRVSEALEEFTRRCRAVVRDHAGSLIYAGGDDVLALLPLHTALSCAVQLNDAFSGAVSPHFPGDLGAWRPTLSVGLGVSHHLTPMSEARQVAKRAEQLAKEARNSLGIVVSKRSGADLAVAAPWADGLAARIWQWVRLFRDEALPDKAAFELERATFLVAQPAPGAPTIDASDVTVALALRALSRRRAGRGEHPLSSEVRALLEGRFREHGRPADGIAALSTELQIARLFLDAWRDAWDWTTQPTECPDGQ